MSVLKEGQKSVRVVLPLSLYYKVKKECPEHGDMSNLVRRLLVKHLASLVDEEEETDGTRAG